MSRDPAFIERTADEWARISADGSATVYIPAEDMPEVGGTIGLIGTGVMLRRVR